MVVFDIKSRRKLVNEKLVKVSTPLTIIAIAILAMLIYFVYAYKFTFTFVLVFLVLYLIASFCIDRYIDRHTSITESRIEFDENVIRYYKSSLVNGNSEYIIHSIKKFKSVKDELIIYGDIDVSVGDRKFNKTGICSIEGIIADEAMELIGDFRELSLELQEN